MDSIHGYAVSKGLLVAANCMSCHGSHNILSHKDPKSTVSRENIPNTCGACHGGVKDEYMTRSTASRWSRAIRRSRSALTATRRMRFCMTMAEFRMQSTPICGSCHADQLATYRDTFPLSQLGLLGGYVERRAAGIAMAHTEFCRRRTRPRR